MRAYIGLFGKPRAFYSDKFSVFRVNIPNALTGTGLTQFGRAMKELEIELICAHSPQAKGRVERANQAGDIKKRGGSGLYPRPGAGREHDGPVGRLLP